MSWCDKLASTAAVGFRLNHNFISGDSIFDALAPITNHLVDGDKTKFKVEQHSSFGAIFITDDGFRYAIDENRISITFNHRLKTKLVSGSAPVMEMLSRPLPYTELLKLVSEMLVKATVLLSKIDDRKVQRVGIISTTMVADEEIPPGIMRFLKYLSRPWKGNIDHYSISITSNLEDKAATLDRCIHQIIRPEDREKLTTLQFDWQRLFKTERAVSVESLTSITRDAQTAALRYFEELAEGSRFDEEIIREAASA